MEGVSSGDESDSLSSRSTSSFKTTSSSSASKPGSIGLEGVLAPKSLDSRGGYYIGKVRDFRKRTFKMEWEMHYFTDDVRITLRHVCECQRVLEAKDIKASYQNESAGEDILCPHCGI